MFFRTSHGAELQTHCSESRSGLLCYLSNEEVLRFADAHAVNAIRNVHECKAGARYVVLESEEVLGKCRSWNDRLGSVANLCLKALA